MVSYVSYVVNVFLETYGPFVFADEAEYAEMARGFASGDFLLRGHSQYGPLFPALVALTSRISGADFYASAITINLFCWITSCYFSYRLARQFGFLSGEAFFCSALMLVAPFWAFGIVVWGDPLFYCIFFVQVSIMTSEFSLPSLQRRIWLGTLAGGLFLAKPIGLFYLMPLILAYGLVDIRSKLCKHQIAGIPWIKISQILIAAFIVIIPWLMRNLIESGSLLGYTYASQLLKNMILRDGLIALVPLSKGFIYQISYIIFSSMGFIGLLVYLWVRYFKELSNEIMGVILYVILAILIVALISDLHNTTHPALGYFVPNGRYLTQFVPIILISSIAVVRCLVGKKVFESSGTYVRHFFILFFIEAMIVLLATPLCVLVPASLVNNPDLGLLFAPEIFPFDRGLPWRGWPHEPSFLSIVGSILLLIPSVLAMLGVLRNWSFKFLILPPLALVVAGSVVQFGGINIMQETQKSLNMLFRYTANICGDVAYFDKDIPVTNEESMYRFWCDGHGIKRTNWADFKSLAHPQSKIVDAIFVTREDRLPLDGTDIDIIYRNADYVVIKAKYGIKG
jgi:hypothetical protein